MMARLGMPRQVLTSQQRTALLAALIVEKVSLQVAAKRFGISKSQAARIRLKYGPGVPGHAPPRAYEEGPTKPRSLEHLGELIFDACEALVVAIIAQARATSSEDWIRSQSADAVSQLVRTEFDNLARFAGSLRPIGSDPALEGGDSASRDTG